MPWVHTTKLTSLDACVCVYVWRHKADPMARFSDNWENDFRPQWELEKLKQGQVGVASDPRARAVRDHTNSTKPFIFAFN